MNLHFSTIVLRSRRIVEVVDLTLGFLPRVAPRAFVGLGLFTLVPAWLLVVSLRVLAHAEWWFVWLTAFFAAWLLELPFLSLAGRLLFDRETRLAQALTDARRTLLPFLGTRALLFGLAWLGAFFVVGPLLVMTRYCFTAEAVVLERSSTLAAFRRSSSFLRGPSGIGFEVTFFRLALFAGFVLLGEVLGSALVQNLLEFDYEQDSLFETGGSPFALFGFFVAVPYATTFRFLSYVNERTRQDGWDVQVALRSIVAGP